MYPVFRLRLSANDGTLWLSLIADSVSPPRWNASPRVFKREPYNYLAKRRYLAKSPFGLEPGLYLRVADQVGHPAQGLGDLGQTQLLPGLRI